MGKYYTGIGSRKAPKKILQIMTDVATALEKKGWLLRSGGANGSDLAFEKGVVKYKNIYLPWRGFNDSTSNLYYISDEALEIASRHHPGWVRLSSPIRKLMARNVYQVQGLNLDENSQFLICWTDDGCESAETRTSKTGGTGLAISLASELGIPIFNLKNEASLERVLSLL